MAKQTEKQEFEIRYYKNESEGLIFDGTYFIRPGHIQKVAILVGGELTPKLQKNVVTNKLKPVSKEVAEEYMKSPGAPKGIKEEWAKIGAVEEENEEDKPAKPATRRSVADKKSD